MPKKFRPARPIYLLAALTIVAIAMLVTSFLLNLRARDLMRAHQENNSLARLLMEQTQQSFRNADLALRGVQDRLQTPYGTQLGLDGPLVRLLLNTRIAGLPQVAKIFVVDANGLVANSSGPETGLHGSVSGTDYFKLLSQGRETGLFIGHPAKNAAKGSWQLQLARRINDPDGTFRGIAVVAIDLDHFEQFYSYMEQDFLRPIGLYMNDGTLIASLPHREADIGKPAPELQGIRFESTNEDLRQFSHRNTDNSQRVFALGYVKGFPFLVSVTSNDAETLSVWRESAMTVVAGTLLVSFFILVAAALLAIELRREAALNSALQEADDRYRLTIDSVMDAIVSVDQAQNVVMFNLAAEHMFGISAADIIGKPLASLMPLSRRDAHSGHFRSFMNSSVSSRGMGEQVDIFGLRADGSEFPLESAISQTMIDGKPQFTAVLRDVTERHRKDADLHRVNSELRQLSISLQSVREEERTRISRELHDELGQQLTGLKLELTWLSARLREGRQPEPGMLDAMREMLDGTILSVRRISTELRPRILDDLDLAEAVCWQVDELTKRSNLQAVCNLPAAELVREDSLATALFRIVQEALTNVARHANADRLEVSFVRDGDELVLSVRDSGSGFVHDENGRGIGLVSMRERATAIDGKFTIMSAPGHGTTIEVRVPFKVPMPVGDET
ncbi:PAS domain S-box protein [Rhodanobacter terrae]|uniref:Oxygen sensor histidine kinase NreB n=1 Tax=Rhodanobacter terrae TaxID=418647 RepID=A0ABW0STD6_9GAMM